MKLTAIVQSGDDGPIRIVTTTLARLERDLANWQQGTPTTLRLRNLYEEATEAALATAWPHRVTGDWFTPAALPIVQDHMLFGAMPDIAQAIDTRHQAVHQTQITAVDQARDKAARTDARNSLRRIAGTT